MKCNTCKWKKLNNWVNWSIGIQWLTTHLREHLGLGENVSVIYLYENSDKKLKCYCSFSYIKLAIANNLRTILFTNWNIIW